MMKGIRVVLLGVIVLGLLGGCEKIKELTKAAEEAAESVTRQVKQEVAADPAQQMLGAYAKGYNEVLNNFQDVVQNYSRAIPFEQEPSAELGQVTFFGAGTYTMSLKGIKEAFDAAATAAPDKYKHLQPMAEELYQSCAELARIYDAARQYYQAEDFKDDEYARGRELHGEMKAAADRFDKALRQMEASLSVEEDRLMEDELAEYKDKATYEYQYRYVHFQAKKTLNRLDQPDGDATTVAKAVDDFLVVYQELKAFADGKPELNASFKAYVDQVDRFVAALKRFRREVQVEQPDPDKLRQEHDSIVSAYNTVISLRNSLSQLEGYGQLK